MPIPAFELMPSPCVSFILPPFHLYLFASSSLTVFSSLSLFLLLVGDVCAAVSEDGLPTQEPASRAVAERPTPQPAQRSSCHAGPSLLQHRESALPSPLLLYLRREKEGGRAVASTIFFFSSEVRHRNERRCVSQKMQ